MKKRITYIVNPHSGIGRNKDLAKIIRENTDEQNIDLEIIKLKKDVRAHDLAFERRNVVDVVVAVGGDGTVNSVASALVGSDTALGIIPSGSGNGLARSLDISLQLPRAIEIINETFISQIDVMHFGGDVYSFNVAGVGFDALVGHKFANLKVRGPIQYMRLVSKEFPNYKPQEYVLKMNDQIFRRSAYLISFANSPQWGFGVQIAPKAVLNDGLIDVCIINDFPPYALPSMAVSLLSQNIDKSEYDEIIRTDKVELDCGEGLWAHIDGEPIMLSGKVTITLQNKALNVVVPSSDFYNNSRFSVAKLNSDIQKRIQQSTSNLSNAGKEIQKNVKAQVEKIKTTITNATQNASDEIQKRIKKGRQN